MAIVILIGRDNLVRQNMARRVDIELAVLVKEVRVLKVMQVVEHAAVHMAVDHRDGIAKVARVCHLAKRRAVGVVLAVLVVVQIKQVVRRALQQGRVDIRTRNVEPCIDIGILLNERCKVDGLSGSSLPFDSTFVAGLPVALISSARCCSR